MIIFNLWDDYFIFLIVNHSIYLYPGVIMLDSDWHLYITFVTQSKLEPLPKNLTILNHFNLLKLTGYMMHKQV
jgi:hypothetical protein